MSSVKYANLSGTTKSVCFLDTDANRFQCRKSFLVSSLKKRTNKLECSSKLFKHGLIFVGKAGAYLSGAHMSYFFVDK